MSRNIFKVSVNFKSVKSVIKRLLIVLLTLSTIANSAIAQPMAFIVVKNARGEVVTYLVTVLAEGCVVKRLNVTHVAVLISNRTKVAVLKDGVAVYEMELSPLTEQRVIEITARLQHVIIRLPHVHSDLVVVRYGDVVLFKYVKNGVFELTNVPYPTNLTLEIPQMKYKVILAYMGEEVIEVKYKKSSYNVYLRFYDVLSKPLPTELIKVVGAEATKVNETHIGLNLSEGLKLKISCYGVSVAEIKVNPSINQVKTIDVKLPVGPLRVVAPRNSTVTIVLPSGEKLSGRCITGKVVFEHVPACKLKLITTKGQLKYEEIIEFPGTLTVNVTLKESESNVDSLLSEVLSIVPVIVISITLVIITLKSKGRAKGSYEHTNSLNKHKKSTRTVKQRARKTSTPKRTTQRSKRVRFELKLPERRRGEDEKKDLRLFKADDLADLINKLKKYRRELEKLQEQQDKL